MTLNRRQFVLAPAAMTALAALRQPAYAQGALEDQVIIRTTGGAFEQALRDNFFDPFTKATGVRIVGVAAPASEMLARTAAMQQAGNVEWDIISPQYDDLKNLSGLLTDLGDCGEMPNVAAQGVAETCGQYGVLYLTGAQVLTYNTEAFPDGPPQSWTDFWNVEQFPGRRALPNTGVPWANIVAALVADGVEPDNLFPLDLDRAFAKLDEIKPHIDIWWKTGDQSQQIFRSGEIQTGLMWSGRAFATAAEGVPLGWTFKDSVADFGAWAIVKDAPHPDAARAFIDFYMDNPEAHAAFSRQMGYATSSEAAHDLLDEGEKAKLVATPEAFDQIIHLDTKWLEENRSSATERWNTWIAS